MYKTISQSASAQELSIRLSEVSQDHAIRLAWIQAYVGVDKNERVDPLAKSDRFLLLPAQAAVPIDMVDVKARFKTAS